MKDKKGRRRKRKMTKMGMNKNRVMKKEREMNRR
jgi:hypothetical protein